MSLLEHPLVSIIVPSFNQGRFIGETLDSILSQDHRPLELIIIDGASTDETLSVLSTYRERPEVRIWSEPDKGVVDAVNKGLVQARGSLIAIQSSDDVYLQGAISAAVDAFRGHPDAGIVFGDVEHIDENSRVTGRDLLPAFSLAEYLGRLTYIPQPAALFRADAAREAGFWRSEVSYVADADFWLRIALKHSVVHLERIMARYRYHPGQRDKHTDCILRDWERAIEGLKHTRGLNPELARAARSGVHLARYRYRPAAGWLPRTIELYCAAALRPASLVHSAFPRRELFPGREPIWALLSRFKRFLGLSPRASRRGAYSLQQRVGAFVLDWPRYERALRSNWILARDRHDHLIPGPGGRGVVCNWRWTRDLHAAKVIPSLGARLLRQALTDWPIEFQAAPRNASGSPRVSFVIGHRGADRLPHLLATIATIAAQRDADIECVVVEQSMRPEVRDSLPEWVRHLHTPPPDASLPYCRSWALNAGARIARGDIVVLHDNDMLVPAQYAEQLTVLHSEGYELVDLKRFIFYMDEDDSANIESGLLHGEGLAPVAVTQNLQGGGSISMSRLAFLGIGGYDESFKGWGGEDNEFWERAETRRSWLWGYMPLIHLWHPSQPLKADLANPNLERYARLSAIPADERIRVLRERSFGRREGLSA